MRQSLPVTTQYCCPGESRPVSRAVHLSRLAAYFPACRDCRHRDDSGQLPMQVVEKLERDHVGATREPTFTSRGIRGVYLNELDPQRVRRMSAAVAAELWRHTERPRVVLARDHRPFSPALAVVASATLRRCGCEVVDLGVVSRPNVSFAVRQLKADCGLDLTGAGRPAQFAGFDLTDGSGLPWTAEKLQRTAIAEHQANRPTRHSGTQQSADGRTDYLAHLRRQFHALRSLHVQLICPDASVSENAARLFEDLNCRLTVVPASPGDPRLPSACARLCRSMRMQRSDLGIAIADDGRRCVVFDELAHELHVESVLLMLACWTRSICNKTARIGVAQAPSDPFRMRLEQVNGVWQPVAGTLNELVETAWRTGLNLCLDEDSCYWFFHDQDAGTGTPAPICDGLVTLARILQTLSLSDRPASAFRV